MKIDTTTQKVTAWLPLTQTHRFPSEGKASHGIGLAPDGTHLYITSQVLNSVAVIDVATNSVVREIPVGQDPNWVDFTSDGKFAVVSNTASNDASIIDIASGKVIKILATGKAPKRLAVGNVVLK